MKSREAKKASAVFDDLEVALRRIDALPPEAMTLEERLTLWARLETLHLAMKDLVRGALPYIAKQKPGW